MDKAGQGDAKQNRRADARRADVVCRFVNFMWCVSRGNERVAFALGLMEGGVRCATYRWAALAGPFDLIPLPRGRRP
jgi:hypothetical protein